MAREVKRKISPVRDKATTEVTLDTEDVAIDVEDLEEESDLVVQEVSVVEPDENLTVAPTPEVTVKIRVNKDVESYIGNRFYRISKGEEADVPKNVKDILLQAGYIQAT